VINTSHLLEFFSGNNLPVILQTEAAECGLASIAMVTCFHGHKVDLVSMRRYTELSLKGATLIDLMNVAQTLELSSRAVRLEPEKLYKLTTPAILHWDMSHFVVLKKATKTGIEIHDPAQGSRTLSLEQVSQHFTGVALELWPNENFQKKDDRVKMSISDFWQSSTGLKRTLGQILFVSLLLQIFALVTPYYAQVVVDEVTVSNDVTLLYMLALGFGFIALFSSVTNGLRSLIILRFSSLLNLQMASNLFAHLLKLPIQFFEKRHIGDVVSRFGSLNYVKDILAKGVIEALLDGLMAITTAVMMLLYSPKLALLVFVVVALYLGFRLALFRPLRDASEEAIAAQASQQSNFMETVRGIQSIKVFAIEGPRQLLWQAKYAEALNRDIRVNNLNIFYQFLNALLFGIEHVLVILLAALMVMEANFSVGMLFAFIAYKTQFSEKVANLVEKVIQFKMLNLHLERIADIAKSEKEQNMLPSTGETSGVKGLLLENLAFRYSAQDAYLFERLELHIVNGQSIAIVGASGCGKSSLMKVMLGLLQPESGTVTFDGQDIRKMGLCAYRQKLGAIMQDDQLLSGSIGDNITLFAQDIDWQHLHLCAENAAIHRDILAMPMQYNTTIGDMGAALSGGQKQRILIARALYKRPQILFMDEATSHLDTSAEQVVNQAIQGMNITRVIIAHRPETIASADRVYELSVDGLQRLR